MSDGLAILAVDDEPRALADIKHLLETSTSVDRVATATSAKEALVYLSGGRYDALFLDVHMPEIEGMALARLLRRFADPPAVVFVTGHPDAAVEAFEIQALDFLVKPVGRERLESALTRVEAQSRPPAVDAPAPRAPARRAGPAPTSSPSTTPRAAASGSSGSRRSRSPRPTATTRGSCATTGASCCARRSASSRRTGRRPASPGCIAPTW